MVNTIFFHRIKYHLDDLKIKISYFSLFFSFFIYLKEERKKFSKSFYSKIYTLIIGNIGKSKNFICFFFLSVYICVSERNFCQIDAITVRINFPVDSRVHSFGKFAKLN